MSRRMSIAVVVVIAVVAVALVVMRGSRSSEPARDELGSAAPSASALASTMSLVVRVRGAEVPVSDARVLLHGPASRSGELSFEAQSGGDGLARLAPAVPGRYRLIVAHPDYALHKRDVDIAAELTELTIVLERGVSLSGVVVDRSARPIANATVIAMQAEADQEVAKMETGASGEFSLPRLPLAAYRLRAYSPRHRPRVSDHIRFSAHGEERRLRIELEEGVELAGRVVDAEGRPIAGAQVGASGDGSLFVETDVDGHFELTGLGREPVNVFATARGYAPSHMRAVRPGGRGIAIVLSAPAELLGRVHVLGRRETLLLAVCSWDQHFNKELCVQRSLLQPTNEFFHFENLPAGAYDLVIEQSGHELLRKPIRLVSGEALTLEPLEIAVPSAAP